MEIVPGVHMIPGIRWSRAYLIVGDRLALVDSGLPWHTKIVMDYVSSIGREPAELDLILVTHGHPDHTSGALAITKRTGAQVVAHVGDTKSLSDREVSLSYMGVFNSLNVPLPFLQRTLVSRVVSDGQVLPDHGGVRVIHSPGHTPGSVCYLLESRGVIFTGDTVFSDGHELRRSVPFPGSDLQQYRRSLDMLAKLEFDTMCGGHGVPLVSGASKRLRELQETDPEPPTWGRLLKSVPRRLLGG